MLVEHALHEPEVGTVLALLYLLVHLSEGSGALVALHGGHRLPEDSDQNFLIASFAELVVRGARSRVGLLRLYFRADRGNEIGSRSGSGQCLLHQLTALRVVNVVFTDAAWHAE